MQSKKWVSLLLTALLSMILVFGLAACSDNNGVNGDNSVPGGNVNTVEPDGNMDLNVTAPDVDVQPEND